MAELDDLLLKRNGLTQDGQRALRELIDLEVLGHLARERGVEISTAQLNARWAQIEAEVIQAGQAENMAQFLEDSGVDRETFREYLRLALIQETLTRQAMGLAEDAAVTAEQQQLWIQSEIEDLGYEGRAPFWEDGIVARIGPLTIQRADFARHLREQIDRKEVRQACYELLLLQKIRQRFPALTQEAIDAVVSEEVAQRKATFEEDPKHQGVDFGQFLATQGLNEEVLRQDPALIAAALSRLWVDRTCDEDCLREVYQAERDLFDGVYGEGAQVFTIRRNAGEVKNELIPRTYAEAEAELESWKPDLKDLAAFQRIAAVRSDEIRARDKGGLLGWVRARTPGVDPVIRDAVATALAERQGPVEGTLIGPLRLQGSVVLVCLGERTAAPTWPVMAENVHRELRRRFMIGEVPPASIETYVDKR